MISCKTASVAHKGSILEYALNYNLNIDNYEHSPPFCGKNWSINVRPLELPQAPSAKTSTKLVGVENYSKCLVYHASSDERAFAVSRLIHAGLCVIDGSLELEEMCDELGVIPYRTDGTPMDKYDWVLEQRARNSNMSRAHLSLACKTAAKASHRLKWTYALFKLYYSYRSMSISRMSVDPDHSPTLPKSIMPEDHVAFAQAISLAYGVIEELGLEIRTKAKEQSRDKNGKWNHRVLQDLNDRLQHSKISTSESVIWCKRGPKSRIEQGEKTIPIQKASWSKGLIRDIEVNVTDAIADLSWLRSTIAAHTFIGRKEGNLASLLTPYDVVNAQDLARKLLLESLGIWHFL